MKPSRRGLLGGSWFAQRPAVVHQTVAPAASAVFWLLDELVETAVADPNTVAALSPWNCLLRLGTLCATCVERCPEPDAITMVDGLPSVSAELCAGCGQCAFACPAPAPALTMVRRTP